MASIAMDQGDLCLSVFIEVSISVCFSFFSVNFSVYLSSVNNYVCHMDKVCSETWCYHLLDTVYSCHSPQKHPYLTVCLNPALQCSRKCGGGSKYRKVRCQQLLSLGQMIDKAEVIIIIMITIILVPIKLIILVPT